MPSVKVVAFGLVSSLLGAREIVLECDGPMTVSAVLDELRRRSPAFADYLGPTLDEYLLIGIGGRAMALDAVVRPGEELVLVPPMSGG